MTPTVHGLWLVCALGATVCAALARPTLGAGAVFAGAAGGAWMALRPNLLPDPAAVGLLAVAGAVVLLRRPHLSWLAAALAGVFAATLCNVLVDQGLWPVPAAAAAVGIPAVSLVFAQRVPAFMPPSLRDEALLVLGAVGILVAMWPGVTEGWRAAIALKTEGTDAAALIVPAWTLALGGLSIAGGITHALWSRR